MASTNISFSTIPASIRKPGVYTEINTALAVRGLPTNAQKVVIIGQQTSSATVAASTLTQIFSDSDAALYAGQGSVVHRMSKALLDANPNLARLDYVGLADPSGAAAKAYALFTGVAAVAGTVDLYVDNHHVSYPIAAADTSANIAGALCSGLAQYSAELAATASFTGSCVAFTARNVGLVGNQIPVSYVIAGATGIISSCTGFNGGTGDPNIGTSATGCLSAIASAGHNVIALGNKDTGNAALLKTYLDWVSSSTEQRPAIAVMGYTDLSTGTGHYSLVKTLGATTCNHGRITLAYLPSVSTVGLEASAYYIGAAYAGVIAAQEDPAQPYNNEKISGLPAVNYTDRLTRTQQEDLLSNGVTPLIVDSGENVVICRAISTYVTNAAGVVDPSLLDLTTIKTLDYVRAATRQRLALRFPNNKLSARTPTLVRAEVLDVLYLLEKLEILYNVKANESGVLVERDLQDVNRLDIRIPAQVVPGLHVIAERIDLLF